MNNQGSAMPEYVKHEIEHEGRPVYSIELLDPQFSGIMVVFNRVKLQEENETVRLKFDYDIINDTVKRYSKKELETVLGLILQELIIEGLRTNSLVYSGGTDA